MWLVLWEDLALLSLPWAGSRIEMLCALFLSLSLSLSLSMCVYRLSKLLLSGLGHGEHGLHIEFSELPVICHLGLGLVSPFRSTGKAQPHIRVSEIIQCDVEITCLYTWQDIPDNIA